MTMTSSNGGRESPPLDYTPLGYTMEAFDILCWIVTRRMGGDPHLLTIRWRPFTFLPTSQHAKKYNLVLPVLTAVAQVVDGQIDAKEAVDTVMTFPQIDDVDRGYDFYKEGEPTAASPSSSREPSNELSGV